MEHDFSLVFETENPLWQRVLSIFEKNEKYDKKIVKNRNLHHKWPRSFSKMLGEKVDNDKDNLISLSLADHFLIHYYYYLLAKKGFRQRMATAFTFMAKKSLKYITPETAEAMAKDYAEARTIANMFAAETSKGNKNSLGRKLSEETREKISHAVKLAYKEGKLNTKGENNPMYGKHCVFSEEHKRKISEAKQGNVVISEKQKEQIAQTLRSKNHTEFSKKYYEHYGYSKSKNINQYQRESYFYKKHGFCSWESVIYNKEVENE